MNAHMFYKVDLLVFEQVKKAIKYQNCQRIKFQTNMTQYWPTFGFIFPDF